MLAKTKNRIDMRSVLVGCLAGVISVLAVFLCSQISMSIDFLPRIATYPIEPIYILYLIFSFILALCGYRHKRLVAFVLFFSFFVIFICSNSGPDYENYKSIYERIADGARYGEVHGEILYYALNRVAVKLMNYDTFRVLYLGAFVALYFYSIYKISPNPALVFFLSYCGLIVYLVSAYRQFATIAILFFAIYLVFENKKIPAIILTCLSVLLHTSGIICVFIVLGMLLKNDKNSSIRKNGYCFVGIVIVVRIVMSFVLRIPFVANLLASVTEYPEVGLITFGFCSRLAEIFILLYFYKKAKRDFKTDKLFKIYFACTLLYIAVPLDFLMARLVIASRFLCILLVTLIAYQSRKPSVYNVMRPSGSVRGKHLVQIFVCLYVVLFLYQMMFQSGYAPYKTLLPFALGL